MYRVLANFPLVGALEVCPYKLRLQNWDTPTCILLPGVLEKRNYQNQAMNGDKGLKATGLQILVVTAFLSLKLLLDHNMGGGGWNEIDVLPLAKQYVDPSWIPGDWYLNQPPGYRRLFQTIFGRLIVAWGFLATSLIGRLFCYGLLASGLVLLGRKLSLSLPSLLLAVGLFIYVDRTQGAIAGEWLVGGLEAKSIAYGLLLLAMGLMLEGRDRWMAFLLGLSTSFHVLVGSWAFVAAVGWLMLRRRKHFWDIRHLASILLIYLGASAFAVEPVLKQLFTPTPTASVQASYIYVFLRLPHHLNPLSWELEDWIKPLVYLLVLTLSVGILQRQHQQQSTPMSEKLLLTRLSTDDPPKSPLTRGTWSGLVPPLLSRARGDRTKSFLKRGTLGGFVPPLLRGARGDRILSDTSQTSSKQLSEQYATCMGLVEFTLLTLVPFLLGLVIAPFDSQGKLLQYYPFRLGDIMLPLNTCLLFACALQQHFTGKRQRVFSLVCIVLLSLACTVQAVSFHRQLLALSHFPSAEQEVDPQWKDMCAWVRRHTPQDAVVISSPGKLVNFAWLSERPTLAKFKLLPQTNARILDWYKRLEDLSGDLYPWPRVPTTKDKRKEIRKKLITAYDRLTTAQVEDLMVKYQADYFVTRVEHQLALPLAYRNSLYILYGKTSS